jgi:hypothetical protein
VFPGQFVDLWHFRLMGAYLALGPILSIVIVLAQLAKVAQQPARLSVGPRAIVATDQATQRMASQEMEK